MLSKNSVWETTHRLYIPHYVEDIVNCVLMYFQIVLQNNVLHLYKFIQNIYICVHVWSRTSRAAARSENTLSYAHQQVIRCNLCCPFAGIHALHVDVFFFFLQRSQWSVHTHTCTHTHLKLFIIPSAVIASAPHPHTLIPAASSAHPHTCWRYPSSDLSSNKSAYITCNAHPFFPTMLQKYYEK